MTSEQQTPNKPIRVTLRVESVVIHRDTPCFNVKYSPVEGVEPYDWYVPIPEGYDPDAKSVTFIFQAPWKLSRSR